MLFIHSINQSFKKYMLSLHKVPEPPWTSQKVMRTCPAPISPSTSAVSFITWHLVFDTLNPPGRSSWDITHESWLCGVLVLWMDIPVSSLWRFLEEVSLWFLYHKWLYFYSTLGFCFMDTVSHVTDHVFFLFMATGMFSLTHTFFFFF